LRGKKEGSLTRRGGLRVGGKGGRENILKGCHLNAFGKFGRECAKKGVGGRGVGEAR